MGRSRAAWLAWSMGALSTGLAVAAVILAGRNGERPAELVFNHHAIGIVTAIGLAVLGALIAAHQPRNPIGWLMAAVTVVPAAVLAVRAWPVRGPELVLQSFEHPSLDGVFSTGFVLVLAAQPRLAHHRAGTAAGRPTDPRLRRPSAGRGQERPDGSPVPAASGRPAVVQAAGTLGPFDGGAVADQLRRRPGRTARHPCGSS
jgi:hypothetical protein